LVSKRAGVCNRSHESEYLKVLDKESSQAWTSEVQAR
jgi:hypothetical protein